MKSTTLTVTQGSVPTLRLVLHVETETGERVVRDLSAVSEAKFGVKGSPDDPDPAPSASYPATIALPDPRSAGVVLVTLSSNDTARAGNKFWKLLLDIGSVAVLGGHGKLSVTTC